MRDDSDIVGRWLFVGCCLGAAIFLVANGLDCRTRDSCSVTFFGSGGIAGAITAVGALLAAVFAARAYFANVAAHRSVRFQKAAELIGAAEETSQITGMHLMRTVVREEPDFYLEPVAKALSMFISTADGERKSNYRPFRYRQPPAADFLWIESSLASAEALTVICTLRPSGGWPSMDGWASDRKLPISDMYLSDKIYNGDSLVDIDISRSIFHSVIFEGCDLSRSEFRFVVGSDVVFRKCTLNDTTIEALNNKAARPNGLWHSSILRFEDCTIDARSTCNGVPAATYMTAEGTRLAYAKPEAPASQPSKT